MPNTENTRELSTSSSSSSIISEKGLDGNSKAKRTRKRFSTDQLIVLEQAFRKCSHPSRTERERLAKQTEMDLKSVTIWFQNKRQTERKVALNNATNHQGSTSSSNGPTLPPLLTLFPNYTSRIDAPPPTFPKLPSLSNPLRALSATSARNDNFLSLDRIASRVEKPISSPRTPEKVTRCLPNALIKAGSVWEAMPSSPVQPEITSPFSPFSRDILNFVSKKSASGRTKKKTLEWACAAAHIAEKSSTAKDKDMEEAPPPSTGPLPVPKSNDATQEWAENMDTDVDSDSAGEEDDIITPETSQIVMDWKSPSPSTGQEEETESSIFTAVEKKKPNNEDDIMNAAWALCGLSRAPSQ